MRFPEFKMVFLYQNTEFNEPCYLLYLRKFTFDGSGKRAGCHVPMEGLGRRCQIADHPVDPVRLLVEPIVTQFKMNIEEDQETAGHSHCQTCHVDEAEGPFAPKVSEPDFEIIFQHIQI